MKTAFQALLLAISLLVALVTLTTGCTNTPTTQIAGDPVVINAEKSIEISFLTIDAFLLWERQNAAIVPPDVAKAATALRREAPDSFRNARAVLRAYKTDKTPQQRVLLDQWLATITELARVASTIKPH